MVVQKQCNFKLNYLIRSLKDTWIKTDDVQLLLT